MNTTQINYYIVLARTLSYTKASEELGISQPTLSKAMRHLEEECMFPLFRKEGRSIALTAQGEQFLPYAVSAMSALEHGLEAVTYSRKKIAIGCVLAIAEDMPDIITAVKKVFPDIYVRIRNGVTLDLMKLLENHELDLIFCTNTAHSDSIVFEPFVEQQLYLCVPKNHRLASRNSADIYDLEGENVVAHNTSGRIHSVYSKLVAEKNIHVNIVAEADEDSQIVSRVERGFGITLISTNNPDQYSNVRMIPLNHDQFRRTVCMAYHADDTSILPIISHIRTLKN